MKRQLSAALAVASVGTGALLLGVVRAQEPPKASSYSPVVVKEAFADTMARMSSAKAGVMKRQMDLLAERYDLAQPARQGRDDVARQAGAGRRARASCRRATTWDAARRR